MAVDVSVPLQVPIDFLQNIICKMFNWEAEAELWYKVEKKNQAHCHFICLS